MMIGSQSCLMSSSVKEFREVFSLRLWKTALLSIHSSTILNWNYIECFLSSILTTLRRAIETLTSTGRTAELVVLTVEMGGTLLL